MLHRGFFLPPEFKRLSIFDSFRTIFVSDNVLSRLQLLHTWIRKVHSDISVHLSMNWCRQCGTQSTKTAVCKEIRLQSVLKQNPSLFFRMSLVYVYLIMLAFELLAFELSLFLDIDQDSNFQVFLSSSTRQNPLLPALLLLHSWCTLHSNLKKRYKRVKESIKN